MLMAIVVRIFSRIWATDKSTGLGPIAPVVTAPVIVRVLVSLSLRSIGWIIAMTTKIGGPAASLVVTALVVEVAIGHLGKLAMHASPPVLAMHAIWTMPWGLTRMRLVSLDQERTSSIVGGLNAHLSWRL